MKKTIVGLIILVVLLGLAGCAAGVNEMVNTPDGQGVVAGFWRGIWNGFISPVTLIISLFNKNVAMYEVHNNGGWYNFGFLLGAMIIFGGGGRGAASGRRRR